VFNREASIARKEYLSLNVCESATEVAEIFIKLKERLTLYLNKKNRTIYLQLYINS